MKNTLMDIREKLDPNTLQFFKKLFLPEYAMLRAYPIEKSHNPYLEEDFRGEIGDILRSLGLINLEDKCCLMHYSITKLGERFYKLISGGQETDK